MQLDNPKSNVSSIECIGYVLRTKRALLEADALLSRYDQADRSSNIILMCFVL